MIGVDDALTQLGRVGVATLGSLNAEGQPHLVPVVFAVSGHRIIIPVDQKPKTTRRLRRLDNIRRDSRVSLLAHHYEADWSRLWWVRIDGHATVDTTVAADVLERLIGRYPPYESAPPLGPFIVVVPQRAAAWAASA